MCVQRDRQRNGMRMNSLKIINSIFYVKKISFHGRSSFAFFIILFFSLEFMYAEFLKAASKMSEEIVTRQMISLEMKQI